MVNLLFIAGYAVFSTMIFSATGAYDGITQFAQLVGAAVLGAGCAVIDQRERQDGRHD